MKLQILSDAHTEMHADGGKSFVEWVTTDADVLVIAGDLGTTRTLREVLRQFCQRYPHVIYVLGNHEYYGSSLPEVRKVMGRTRKECPNLHWLENEVAVIDGQRFVGSTLWFPDDGSNEAWEGHLNDFWQILNFRDWVYNLNQRSMAFLADEVRAGDVVVTHHIPTVRGITPRWVGSFLNRFFVCDMTSAIEKTQPKFWAYGHTHDSNHLLLGETELICNPFGYARREENRSFDPRLIIEV